jgi:hypothetical protein
LEMNCRLWQTEGVFEVLKNMLASAAAGGVNENRLDKYSYENIIAATAVRYLRYLGRTKSCISHVESLLLLLLPFLLPSAVCPPVQIEISDTMAQVADYTLVLQNPAALSQIVIAAKVTENRDVKSSLVMLLSRLFFNCPSVQQEIIRLKALPLLHEMSAAPAPSLSSCSSDFSASSYPAHSTLFTELSRARAHELYVALHQPDVATEINQVESDLFFAPSPPRHPSVRSYCQLLQFRMVVSSERQYLLYGQRHAE